MYLRPVPHTEPNEEQTNHAHPESGHCHFLSDADFFQIVGLEHLSSFEKQKRRHHMETVVMLSFINHNVPELLTHSDITELEAITENIESIDFAVVERFFQNKISNYKDLMSEKMYALKKELVRHHYQALKKQYELDLRYKHIDEIPEFLACERILSAAEQDEWQMVKATVKYATSRPTH